MKLFKRTLSVLLTTAMLTSAVISGGITIHASEARAADTSVDAVTAAASGTEDEMPPDVFPDTPADPADVAGGACGDDLTWSLDDTGVFVVSGTGAMTQYSISADMPWHAYRSDIKQIIIEDSVTEISSCGIFMDCTNLTSVVLSDSMTTVPNLAFSGCSSLTSIELPEGVTDIDTEAFMNCVALESIYLPETLTEIGDKAFYGCSKLISVTIPEGVTELNTSEFGKCTSLSEIILPDTMVYVDITSFSGTAFWYDESNRTEDGLLYLGDHLLHVDNSVFSASHLDIRPGTKSISANACMSIASLVSVTCPEGLLTIGKSAFLGCTELRKIDVPDSVERIYGNPLELTKFMYMQYPDGFLYLGKHLVGSDHTHSGPYKIKEGTKTICPGALTGSNITELTIPDSVWLIDSYALSGISCTEIVIPETVTQMGREVLRGCGNLEKAVFNASVDEVPVQCFADCDALKSLVIGEAVESVNLFATFVPEPQNCEVTVPHNTVVTDSVAIVPPNITLNCSAKSSAEEYAIAANIPYVLNNVTTNGVMITLSDLHDIKDFFIAKGQFETYRAMKDNGYIVNVTNAKLGDKTEYTYTVYEPGVHTVIIRYNDGSMRFFYPELTVDEPVFETNGLQVTVSNIPGIKVIRTAYGEWTTTKQVKAADTYRCFSNKTAIKDADSFKIQYRDEGIVTIIVEYTNGYAKVFHHDVQKLEPTVDLDGNTLTFGNLDGLNVLRYAKGQYTTSAEIKRAEGSKALKLRDAVDGKITVSGLDNGTYTFCVQYNDESFNIYTFDIDYKTSVLRFENPMVEGFEPLEYRMNVGDTYYDAFGGLFPDPGVRRLDDGSVFVGWYLDELSYLLTEDDMRDMGYLALEGAWTFEALYLEADHEVIFDPYDGTVPEGTKIEYGINTGESYSEVVDELPVAEKEGYVFKGWYNREHKIVLTANNLDKVFDLDCDLILLPIWEAVGEKTSVLRFSNPFVEGFEQFEYQINVGDFYLSVFEGEFPDPGVRRLDDGYVFAGWYLDELSYLLTENDMWDMGYLALEGDWNFEALYLEPDHRVIFDPDGGIVPEGTKLEYGINTGENYSEVIAELPVAEKEGYVFKGWYNEQYRITLTPDNIDGACFELDSDLTLVPIWDPDGEKVSVLRFENPMVEGFEPLEYWMNAGDSFFTALGGILPDPGVRELDDGRVFVGWYLDEFDYLLTEDNMWDMGYLYLAGNWTFEALYLEPDIEITV